MTNNILQKFKKIVWPIEAEEHRFFIPMAAMMMFALYNFASLRSIKDCLVVANIGAESISFLKLWFALPAAVTFTIIYFRLSNRFTSDVVFYIVTTGFLVVFFIFCTYLYPNRDKIHLSKEEIQELTYLYPNFKWFIRILGNWSYALMYVFSELWSVVIINLMFWQFANHTVESKDAKRFYPLFGLVGNFGLVLSGNAMVYFSNLKGVPLSVISLFASKSATESEISLKLSIISVIFSGIIMMLLMHHLNRIVIKDKKLHLKSTKTTVTKLSLRDSIRLVLSSKYVGMITIIIICYGLSINVLEGPWKAKIKELYPTQNQYLNFMGNFNIWMGTSCITFMIIGSNVIRFFSWRVGALFTPTIIAITGFAFFLFVIYSAAHHENIDLPFNPLYAAVIAGAMQNILSKSSKYSMFDATKELAYIPLSLELRTKGKASAEVVGAKLGKSMGAIIQSAMFTIMPLATFSEVTPILMCIFIIVVIIWILDIFYLDHEYSRLVKEK